MIFSKKLSDLEAQIATLLKERDEARADATRLTGLLETANTQAGQVTVLTAANADLTVKLTAHEATIAELNGKIAKAEADREAEISRQVTERCAAAGVEPISRDPGACDPKDPDRPGRQTGVTGMAAAREKLNARHRELHTAPAAN